MKNVFALLLAMLSTAAAIGQVAETLDAYKKRYPEKLGVYLQKKEAVTISLNNEGSLDIESEITEELIYLDDQANMLSEHSIPYSASFTDISNIKAYTLTPVKDKYKKMTVGDVKTMDATSRGVFADDLKKKKFLFPALTAGAKSMLTYTEANSEPHLFGSWYFSSGLPVEHSEFSITFPKGVEIRHKPFNTDGVEVAFTEATKGGKTTLRWVANNIITNNSNENAPNFRYYEPHLIAYIASFEANGEKVDLLNGIDGLHSWYTELLGMRERAEDAALKTEVDKVIEGASTELEKVQRIYYWVQDNVKYIAFEEGMGGFVPRDPYQIYDKRFGDCKDMSSLINEMLELANIPSYLTWIGTRDIPYSYKEVPTPHSDNHMICTYQHGDEYIFLDATGPYSPLMLPTSHIQGKEALLHINDGEHRVVKVPVPSATSSSRVDTVHLSLKDGVVHGNGTIELSGYQKVRTTMRLLNRKESDREKFFQRYLQRGNNKFFLDGATHHNLGDRDKDLSFDYQFRIEDYALKNNDELYLNPHLIKDFTDNKIDLENQDAPIEWDYKRIIKDVVYIDIPDGYEVSYLPENNEYIHDQFGYSLRYAQEEGRIAMHQEITLDVLLVEPEYFEEWNAMVKSMSRAFREIIIFKSTSN